MMEVADVDFILISIVSHAKNHGKRVAKYKAVAKAQEDVDHHCKNKKRLGKFQQPMSELLNTPYTMMFCYG